MNITLQKGQRWQNREDGIVHTVLEISAADGVVTWSDPAPAALQQEGISGYSFMGPIAQFLNEFKLASPGGVA